SRVLGASHDPGPPLRQVVKEAAKVEAHFPVCVKVHFPNPNKSRFQLLSLSRRELHGRDLAPWPPRAGDNASEFTERP
uniref:Uncharacterized protein n=1 Tax=Oryctolagus cuniculus TaxID=9986 RepID=A0A5F9C8L4_RABIT